VVSRRALALAVLVALALAPAALASGKFITVVTGSTGGTYYPVGTILVNHFNRALGESTGIKWSVQSSGGTVENIEMVQRGEAEMGIGMGNLVGFSFLGIHRYEGKPHPDLRYVMALWPEASQFVYSRASGIKGWGDLKGKRIAVGPAASGTEFSSRVILKAVAGLTFDDIKAERLGYSEASQALQNGTIDAALLEAGVPTSAVAELYAGRTEVDMLPFGPEEIARLVKEAPWYTPFTLRAGTYPRQDKDVPLVAVMCSLFVHKDVPEDVVYRMLEVIMKDREELIKEHAVFSKVDFDNPIKGLFGAPLHPGAVKFFKERGLEVPAQLLPPERKQ